MTYYLTRDPELLAGIVALKRHIFRAYDDGNGLLLWVLEGEDAPRRELVSQLDQINAYMLLLAPILPEPHRSEWKRDLERLADGMVQRYYSPELGMFRGTIHDPAHSGLGTRHTDFGHTIKAFWMIERVGRVTGRADLVDFAVRNAPRVLERAWVKETGCWATGYREDGSLDRSLVWWSFAELDQMTATLALRDRSFARNLPASARCWFDKIVDREQHEVWGYVDPDDPTRHFMKAHLWKNGYHSAEHALVGYLTAQQLHGQPSTLWFAFNAKRADVRPYVFEGRVVRLEPIGDATRVTFTRLR
jgi:mannose/cellobiose epimerase-like protein (N-acyl-D-glucosamine 2-epimerase family)